MLVVANLPMFLIGALSVALRAEFSLGRAQLGLSIAVMLGAAALGSMASGWCVHRLGTVNALRVSALFTGVAAAGVGLLTSAFTFLLPWLALAGLGLALCEAAGTQLVAERVKPTRLGTALGIKQACPPLATMIAGFSVPLLASVYGWRAAFVCTAALALLVGLGLPPSIRRRSSTQQRRPRLTRRAPMLLLSLGLGLGLASSTSAATFLVDSTVELGVSITRSGLLLAGASSVAIVARLAVGRSADTRSIGGTLRLVGIMLSVGATGYVLLATGEQALVIVGALMGFGIGNGWNGLAFLAVARAGGEASAAAMGLVLIGGFIGALSGPLATGFVVDTWSYREAWTLVAAGMVLSAVVIMFASRRLTVNDVTTAAVPPRSQAPPKGEATP